MANSGQKRLQVFVSSTYDDLRAERQAAVEAILQAGHIPAGMELFAAGDQSQMEVIRRWIDDSDVFLLILGGRYGSIEKVSGKSYTHLEFEHAVATGKPRFSCVIREETATKRGEQTGGSALIEREHPGKWKDFRAEAGNCMVEPWDDAKDIKLGIHKALAEIARRVGLGGWVRDDDSFNAVEMANELARLSRENAELRGRGGSQLFGGLTFDEMVHEIDRLSLFDLVWELEGILCERGEVDMLELVPEHGPEDAWIGREFEGDCVDLRRLGIVDCVRDSFIRLTDDGKRFLNRWSMEMARGRDGSTP